MNWESIGIFLLILSVLVMIHELGHYTAARLFGIRVDEFAFGLPFTRALISKKIGETTYSIYPLLFGGFVKLHGEESEVKDDPKRSFFARNKLQRVIVIVAGVFMNLVLALGAFFVVYARVGVPTQTYNRLTVVEVLKDSPAQAAGFLPYDRLISIEGKEITSAEQFTSLIESWKGLGVNVTVERGETSPLLEGLVLGPAEQKTLYVVPKFDPQSGKTRIGVGYDPVPVLYLRMEQCSLTQLSCVGRIMHQGVVSTNVWIGRMVDGLRNIGKSLAALQKPKDLSGPVGIYKLTELVAQQGVWPTVELVAILSLNLAIFNILPIPALDGGRVLFIFIEWIRRKRLSAEFENRVNTWGMVVLLTVMVLITLQDVANLEAVRKLLHLGPVKP